MKNNKDYAEVKNKEYDFNIVDADYFHSDENESALIKSYLFKKILMCLLLSAALLVFIFIYIIF